MYNKEIDREVVADLLDLVHQAKYLFYNKNLRLMFYWKGGRMLYIVAPFGDWQNRMIRVPLERPNINSMVTYIRKLSEKCDNHMMKYFHPWEKPKPKKVTPKKAIEVPRTNSEVEEDKLYSETYEVQIGVINANFEVVRKESRKCRRLWK